MSEKLEIIQMMKLVEECIKNDKLEFLATLICKLQREYQEVCSLSTDGEYQPSWDHIKVLDFLTYEKYMQTVFYSLQRYDIEVKDDITRNGKSTPAKCKQ